MKKIFLLLILILFIGCSDKNNGEKNEKNIDSNIKKPVLLIDNRPYYNEDIINYAYYLLQEIDEKDVENTEIKDKILNDFINHILLLREAKKAGINIDRERIKKVVEKFNKVGEEESLSIFTGKTQPDIGQVEKIIYENMVVQAYLNKLVEEKVKVTEEDLKAYYDNMSRTEEYKTLYNVWHIFTTDKKKADKARELLRRRNSFKKIAENYSEDPYAEKGGDMGYVDLEVMPEVFQYVKKMRIREVSPVIKSDYGYHIFSLRNISKSTVSGTFEEVSGEIYSKVYESKQNELIENLIKELRKNAEIKIISGVNFTFEPDNSSKNN